MPDLDKPGPNTNSKWYGLAPMHGGKRAPRGKKRGSGQARRQIEAAVCARSGPLDECNFG